MVEQLLSQVRIVLVEPAGPLNVGAIARVMKNMGLRQLVLVNPHCDHRSADAKQMAVHAGNLLESAQVTETLIDGLKGCQRAIATTARVRTLETPLEHPRDALPWLLEAPDQPSALIFGPEDRGLSNEELNHAQRFVCIPSSPAYPSLNLAQAVAICCYEIYQYMQQGDRGQGTGDRGQEGVAITSMGKQLRITPHSSPPPAPLDTLEAYYQQLETVLLTIGYLYPHTAPSRMKKFRRLFNRALPTEAEVAMLRGVLSQVEWAIQSGAKRGLVNPASEKIE